MSANDKPHNTALVPVSATASRETVNEGEFETIERFQALEPGHYWTAQKDGGEFAPKGETLLLMDVTEFEGKVHSVTLRVHPRHSIRRRVDMLVHEFLDVFLPCPDGEAVRHREQQEVMQEVSHLQAELMRTSGDPQLLLEAVRKDVEAGIKELEREEASQTQRDSNEAGERARNLAKTHRRAARRSAAKGNPLVAPKIAMASEVGSLIEHGINEQGVAELTKMASRQAVVARAQSGWMESQTKGIVRTMEKLQPYIEERSAVALARTSGAVKMVERIKRGIESLDLYTGRNVDVFDIRTGADAPSSEPLTLVQGKRYAEEEFAVWADVDASFDWQNKKEFFDAIAVNDDLLNQVFPTSRCVISMAMTRRSIEYKDALSSLAYNIQNHFVFLLVRNGDNVHVVYSGSPSHEGARRLFPTKDEMERPFIGADGKRVSIRDVEFGEASKQFENMALVYRRFLILLCGLDHRLKLMGNFYPSDKQMEFMSAGFQASHFRFLFDQESGWLIGDEMPALSDWFATKNAMLQSGSRVFMLNGAGVARSSPEIKRRNYLRARGVQFARPFLAFKDGGRLIVTVEASDSYGDRRIENVKCHLTGDENDAHEDAWWLCVDGVQLEEVRRYRHSRVSRSMGVSYLRLFRRLESYLELERAQEADARAYLLKSAVEFGGLTAEQASAALGAAVRNWRASRRGAALPGVEERSALNDVLTLMVPEGHLTREMQVMLDEYLAQSGVMPLLLTRSGKAKLMLYVVANDADKAPYPKVLTWGWVRRITLDPGKTKLKEGSSTLLWLTKVLPASEVEVRRWDGLGTWLNEKDEPLTLRKYGAVLPQLEAAKEWEKVLRAGRNAGIPEELFQRIYQRMVEVQSRNRSRYTIDQELAIPVAAYSIDGRKLKIAYMRAYAAMVLYTYGDHEQRKLLRDRFSKSPAQGAKLTDQLQWALSSSSTDLAIAHDEPIKEGIRDGKSPAWAYRNIQVNCKRKGMFPSFRSGKRKSGEPLLRTDLVRLSFDRALGQLHGSDAGYLKRKHRKDLLEEASRGSWAWGTEHRRRDGESDEALEARLKAQREALSSKPYAHPYVAVLSPLVWSPATSRPMANACFVAPLLKKSAELKGAAEEPIPPGATT